MAMSNEERRKRNTELQRKSRMKKAVAETGVGSTRCPRCSTNGALKTDGDFTICEVCAFMPDHTKEWSYTSARITDTDRPGRRKKHAKVFDEAEGIAQEVWHGPGKKHATQEEKRYYEPPPGVLRLRLDSNAGFTGKW